MMKKVIDLFKNVARQWGSRPITKDELAVLFQEQNQSQMTLDSAKLCPECDWVHADQICPRCLSTQSVSLVKIVTKNTNNGLVRGSISFAGIQNKPDEKITIGV